MNWTEVEGYEEIYEVSSCGRVRRIHPKPHKYFMQEQTQFRLPNGYWTVKLRKPGQKRINAYVHRLTADAFVPNPEGLPEVNHDDGDKDNNNDWNLVWTTRGGNNTHKNRVLLTHHNQMDVEVTHPSGEKEVVRNLSEFCENYKLTRPAMSMVLSGKRNHHKGFTASYL